MGNYFYDPWTGMKQGTETLRQAWKDVLDAKREEQTTRNLGLAAEQRELELSELKRKLANAEQMRQALSDVNDYNTSTADRYASEMGVYQQGLNKYQDSLTSLANSPEVRDIQGLRENVTQYPGLAQLSGSNERLAGMESAIQLPTPPTPPAQPEMKNPLDTLYAMALKSGDIDQITGAVNLSTLMVKNSPSQLAAQAALTQLETAGKAIDTYATISARNPQLAAAVKPIYEGMIRKVIPAGNGYQLVLPEPQKMLQEPAVQLVDAAGKVIGYGTRDKDGAFKVVKEGEQWGPLEPMKIDGKTVFVQRSSTGKINAPVQGPAPIRVTTNQDAIDARQERRMLAGMQEKMRSDKVILQATDSDKKIKQLETTYAEGKKSGNYTGADQVIGYLINKVLDPDSVVMVSEFQRIAATQGVPEKVYGNLQALSKGGIKLTDKSRDALIRTMKVFNEAVQARKQDRVEEFRQDALSLGLDADAVIGTRGKKQADTGEVDGYTYKVKP